MACGSCSKRRRKTPIDNVSRSEDYDLTGGMDIRSLNARQVQARLEVFKRRFCKTCNDRYSCDYPSYIKCKGNNPK
jgi:transposase